MFDINRINKKEIKPVNPLIFQTAADLCASWFDVALSSGMPRGKYVGRGDKPIRMFVADNLEKFLPLAIHYLLEMLKPTANTNQAMKDTIFAAITDPLNDPDLMDRGRKPNIKNETEQMVLDAIRKFDKNKIGNISTQSILHMPTEDKPLDLKGTTGLKQHG